MKLTTTVIATGFSLLLYLQMCIASLGENYQVGIRKIQLFQPSIIVLFMIIICLISVKNTKTFDEIYNFTKLAFIACGVLFIFFFSANELSSQIGYWSFPHERTLIKTLKISLFHPQFSNRSIAILFQNIFLLLVLIFILFRKRKHKN